MAGSPQHATLVAATVTTLTFDAQDFNRVEVTNVTGTASVYFTVNGVTPVAKATGTHVVTAGVGHAVEVSEESLGRAATVKLISTGTPDIFCSPHLT